MSLEGTFRERPADEHVDRRRRLLASDARLRSPNLETLSLRASEAAQAAQRIRGVLDEHGALLVRFDELPGVDTLVELGSRLGDPIPETDEAVAPFVEREVVLNLETVFPETTDASIQPFARNGLTLHTESSGRPVAEQPRYIALLCCKAEIVAAGGLTLLVPMADVVGRLTPHERDILARMRYRGHGRPPILRRVGREQVLSFRDFREQPLAWTYSGQDQDEESVNRVLRGLLRAMYAPESAMGHSWETGMFLIFDNRSFIHGRTDCSPSVPLSGRHLRRLRIR